MWIQNIEDISTYPIDDLLRYRSAYWKAILSLEKLTASQEVSETSNINHLISVANQIDMELTARWTILWKNGQNLEPKIVSGNGRVGPIVRYNGLNEI